MKVMLLTLFVSLVVVITLNSTMDPFGLIGAKGIERFTSENKDQCAIDIRFIPEGGQQRFKMWLLEHTEPEAVVLGTSRVMSVRREHFENKKFVNFGISGIQPESYPNFAGVMKDYDHLKLVLIGLDFFYFGNNSWKNYEAILKLLPNPTLMKTVRKALIAFGQMKLDPVFQSDRSRLWRIASEYLSYPATKRSLEMLLSGQRGDPDAHRIDLPKAFGQNVNCVLSASGDKSQVPTAWGPLDASTYQRNELVMGDVEAAKYPDKSIFTDTTYDGLWGWFLGFTDISDYKIGFIDSLLSQLAGKGVQVVGFMPPFASEVMDEFHRRGLWPLYEKLETKFEEVFSAHGFKYVSLKDAGPAACSKMGEYRDARHPGSECAKKIVKYIQSQLK